MTVASLRWKWASLLRRCDVTMLKDPWASARRTHFVGRIWSTDAVCCEGVVIAAFVLAAADVAATASTLDCEHPMTSTTTCSQMVLQSCMYDTRSRTSLSDVNLLDGGCCTIAATITSHLVSYLDHIDRICSSDQPAQALLASSRCATAQCMARWLEVATGEIDRLAISH